MDGNQTYFAPKNSLKIFLLASLLLLIGIIFLFLGYQQQNRPELVKQEEVINIPSPQLQPTALGVEGEKVFVNRVVDGDTIELEDGRRVRYIGIDTPETVDPRREVGCFGKEASDQNKDLVEGKTVILVKDVSDTDKYNRLLRYVYLEEERGLLFVNDYLVRQGFAKASAYPPDVRFTEQFRLAEREAREANRGLWEDCQ